IPPLLAAATIRLVGFGAIEFPNSQVGEKRTVTTSIDAQDGEIFRYHAGSCYGDSGGPAFLSDGESEQLVGIISAASFACDSGRAARLDQASEWLSTRLHRLESSGSCEQASSRCICMAERCGTGSCQFHPHAGGWSWAPAMMVGLLLILSHLLGRG